jgi:hypothetical protein
MRIFFSTLGLSLSLFLAVSPANSQPFWNPTASDGHANTAGGTGALNNTTAYNNTA